MNEAIPQLQTYDEPALDQAFATLAKEVRTADTTSKPSACTGSATNRAV
jgi:hypothetical protein